MTTNRHIGPDRPAARTRRWLAVLWLLVCGLALLPAPASAQLVRAFTARFSANVNGDIKLIGNTSMTCNPAGTNGGNCVAARNGANFNNNDFSMIHDNTSGDATTFNATSSNLNIPATATVLYAGLYWGGNSGSAARGQVLIKSPTAGGFTTVNASQLDPGNAGAQFTNNYSAFADVTNYVRTGGVGYYTVANVQSTPQDQTWGGWGLVVAYQDNAQPLRNIVIYDGYSVINNASGAVTLVPSGFLTPLSGPIITRIGSMGWDGDRNSTGDNLAVNGTPLTDALNVTNNYFNSSLSDLGALATTNIPSYNNQLGVDVDRSNVPAGVIANGASSATITATSTGETYYLAVVTFSTDIYVPVITPNVTKTATDLNGGYLLAGDVLRWTISMSNTGLDSGTNLVLTDPIPNYTTYVPNSLRIISGANAGPKSDTGPTPGPEDQAEKTGTLGSANPVVFRLGAGATNTTGGTLAYGQSTSLSFDTVVGVVTAGTQILNTASLTYSGQTLSNTSFSTSSSATAATVMGPPTITKSFTPAVIAASPATSQLRIVVFNPAANPAALTGVVVADTYPAGLVNAAVPNAQINCTAGATPGTLTGGVAAGNTIGMNPGATIPPNGSCTITVNVSAPAGNYTNTTSPVSTSNAGNGASASATLSVGKIGIAKSFGTSPVNAGTNSLMTITLTNNTAANLTGVAFTDTYPVDLRNAGAVVTNTCGGTATPSAPATNPGTLGLTGGAIGAGASCSITINVVSSVGAVYNNTTGGATHGGDLVPGNPSNTATLTVVGAPTITKSFSPVSIPRSGVSTMQIVIANPNTTTTVTRAGAVFLDAYPTNVGGRTLNNTNPRSITINCSTGSSVALTAGTGTDGGANIGLSALTLLPGGSCTLTTTVTHSGGAAAAADGAYNNSTGAGTYDNAPASAAGTATLTVTNTQMPTPVKAFTPATIGIGGTSSMTITITAPAAASPMTGVSFTDGYPGNLFNTATAPTSTGCGTPVLTAAAGGTSLTMTGGTVVNGTPCVITQQVTASAAGSITNSVGPITANNVSSSVIASGTLQVVAPPVITKSFGTNPVATATNSLLTITLTNPASNPIALSGIAFTDPYPGTLRNNTGGVVTSNSCGGTPVVSGNGTIPGSLAISGVTLAVGATCTITVNTQSAAAGTFANTTGNVTSTQSGAGATAMATLTVGKLGITKAFAPATIPSGGVTTMTFSISNGSGVARTGLAFADKLFNMQLLNGAVGGTCTGVVSNAAAGVTGDPGLVVTAGDVPAGGCTVTFQVTSSTPGVQPNTSSGVTHSADPVAGAPSNTATLTVTPTPSVTKSFVPSSTGVYVSPAAQTLGQNMTRLTISILNPNTTSATGATLTDTYPANMVNATTPGVTNTCGGTVTATAGTNTITLVGGTLPLNSACSIGVNVVSTVAGNYTNTIPAGALTSSLGPNANAGTADVQILQPPLVGKSFSPGSIGIGATSQLMITLTNPNAVSITGAAFTDTYPAGVVNAAVPNPVTSCSPGSATTPATNQLVLSGATIPPNSSCNVTVNVTAAAAGSYVNTLAVGAVTSTNAGSNTAAASDTLLVGRPRIDKAFAPNPILPGGVSVLSFTLTNSSNVAMTAAAFTDNLPVAPGAMVVANPASATNSCGGTFTATVGANSVNLAGGTVPAASTCNISVRVTAPVSGNYNNVSGAVSTSAGTGNTAAATLTVMAGPTVAKLFAPSTVGINQVSQLTITVSNPNSFAITGAAFTDTYPAGLVNSATPAGATTCSGGSVTAANGGGSLTLSGATIPANGACTVTVNVIGTTAGVKTNTLPAGLVTSTNAPPSVSPVVTANLTVLSPPVITKAFSPGALTTSAGTSLLTITLTNPNTTAITGAGFTDNYPAGLTNAAAANPATTCGSGTVLATNNGTFITLVGGVIPASGSCTVTVTVGVTSTASVSYFNNTGPVATTNAGTGTGGTATLTVNAPPVVTKSFAPAAVAAININSTLTITITNSNPGPVTGVTFNDQFPANLVINGALTGDSCTLAPALDTTGNNGLVFNNVTIPANTTCTVSIAVRSGTVGTYTNCINPFTPANTSITTQACSTFQVGASNTTPPNITKTFSPTTIGPGGTSQLIFVINNVAGAAATAVAFADTYPAGVVNTSPANVIGNCGGGTVTAAAGSGSITLTGGALAATTGTCTIQTSVTAAAAGIYNNTSGTVSATINAGTRTGNTASAALVVATPVSIAKAFGPSTINSGGTSVITFTLTNPNGGATIASFTDALNGMQAVGGAAGGTCVGAGSNNVTAGATSLSITGLTVPGSSVTCTVTVPVTSTTPGVLPNATSGVTANGATGGPSNTASLTVNAGAPSITKAFSPATIAAGTNTTMTFTLTNPNGAQLTGMSFTDGMTNMSLATVPSVGGTCAGITTSATGGATSFTVTGGTIPANGSCTVTVQVTSNVVGVWPNISSGVTTNETPTAGSQSNTANLTVLTSGAPVSGIVYNDVNANGTLDNAEDWTAGTPVFVNLVSGGVVVQSVSLPAGTGAYSFSNVAVGNYTIVVTNSNINVAAAAPATWSFTGPTTGTITTAVGTTGLPGQNFGLRQGQRISGRVFRDTGAVPLGTTPNNGILDTNEAPANPQNPALQPVGYAGVTVNLYNNVNCTGAPAAITSTDGNGNYTFPSAAAGGAICIQKMAPTGSVATGASSGATALPSGTPTGGFTYCRGPTACGAQLVDTISFTAAANTTYANLNFGVVPANTFTADQTQQGAPGTTLNYAHTYVPGTVGSVTFTSTAVARPNIPGWSEVIYRDNNCNATLDAGEAVLSGAVAVNPNDTTVGDPSARRICLIVREFIPPGAPAGAENRATITAAFVYTNANPALNSTLTVVDTTLSGSATGGDGLRLRKEVCNVTQQLLLGSPCNAALTGAGAGNGFADNNVGRSGDELMYRIVYNNASSNNLSTIVISDAAPPYTVRAATAAAYVTTPAGLTNGTITQPAAGQPGNFSWTFTGNLAPNLQGVVTFSVVIQ